MGGDDRAGTLPDAEFVERCDQGRDLDDKAFPSACYAPFSTFDLDPRGYVLGCCLNSVYPMGNIADDTLLGIWRGERAEKLRRALERYDHSHGCGTCRWQVESGKELPLSHKYDQYPVPSRQVGWPAEIGFALSNTCNLECVQCNGEYSSRIRSRREGRTPIRSPYDDAFFTELREFLPHLRAARFVGGEPFLIRDYFRIWDMLREMGLRPRCDVTTNGTIYNDRVEQALEALPFSITVSLDAPHKEPFEAIRCNADFDVVMANVERFRSYAASNGTTLSVSHCLMRNNWQHFGDLLRMAESWGASVFVSTVFNDPYSLMQAPLDELATVVESLEAQRASVLADLELNATLWETEIEQLRATLRSRREGGAETIWAAEGSAVNLGLLPDRTESPLVRANGRGLDEESVIADLHDWAADQLAVVDVDDDGLIQHLDERTEGFYGLTAEAVVGTRLADYLEGLKPRLGPFVIVCDRRVEPGRLDTLLGYTTPPPYTKDGGTYVRVMVMPAAGSGWRVILASDEFYPPLAVEAPRSHEPTPVALTPRPAAS